MFQDATDATPRTFEVIPEQEADWRKEITAMTVLLQDKRKALQDGEILRGVHPKSHGCLEAEFTVKRDLPKELRVGLFARSERCFAARVRYSNADVLKRADVETETATDGSKIVKHGSRGMAIKVLDVDGEVLLRDQCACNQDFLMINTPEFAFRNVRDYWRLTLALLASADGATPDLFFLPGQMLKLGLMTPSGDLVDPSASEPPQATALRGLFAAHAEVFRDYSAEDVAGVISAAGVVGKIQSTPVLNPMDVEYFSAAPFRFGPDRVMRYSVAPASAGMQDCDVDAAAFEASDADYLRHALAASIARNALIKLSFRVQIASAQDIEGKEAQMIENASQAWDPARFPHVEVAHLVIDPARQSADVVDACKSYLFTPWHGLTAHEPLGGINRLRKPVYSTSATFRRTT